MWYLDARKYRPGMYDDRLADPAVNQAWGGFDESRFIGEARIHGNPLLDCGIIGWEDSTAVKRAESEVYDKAHEEAASNAAAEPSAFDQLSDVMPAVSEYTQGSIMILNADDPELLECSEPELHERLTSHLAEPYRCREALPDWAVAPFRYMEKVFLGTIESGYVPGPIVVEPIRQRLGFPYEWFGAKVDGEGS